MTSLVELEATFMIWMPNGMRRVGNFQEAQGILFTCPSCFRKNGNSDIGVHSVLVWFDGRNVPVEATPLPRWKVSGTSIHNLSLSPSINLATSEESRDEWHGYITNGQAL